MMPWIGVLIHHTILKREYKKNNFSTMILEEHYSKCGWIKPTNVSLAYVGWNENMFVAPVNKYIFFF